MHSFLLFKFFAIFIKENAIKVPKLEPDLFTKALEQILPDAWISKDLDHAKSFIDWVKSSLFYDLTYNDNDKMLKMIKDIL